MRNLVVIGVIAALFFGLSAGVSLYLQGLKSTSPEKPGEAAALPAFPTAATAPAPTASKTPIRPPFVPEAEAMAQAAARQRDKEEALKKREQQLAVKQKYLEMIFQDIKSEQTGVDELRKQLSAELEAAAKKVADVEKKSKELQQERQETKKKVDDATKTLTEYDGLETDRIKQVAGMYDTMAPESAAKILQTLAEGGNLETAIKILSHMKERQAAKILAEIRDPVLAAQMLERLKGLKKPSTPAKGP
jgi:flagellar motility protein MotE (MotC chaperone)